MQTLQIVSDSCSIPFLFMLEFLVWVYQWVHFFSRDDQVGIVWHSSTFRNSRTQRGVGLFTKSNESVPNLNEFESYWEDSPWPSRSHHVFTMLNSFMERCNDVTELVEVTQQFSKLRNITLMGGACSLTANAQIEEIQEEFMKSWNLFSKNVSVS